MHTRTIITAAAALCSSSILASPAGLNVQSIASSIAEFSSKIFSSVVQAEKAETWDHVAAYRARIITQGPEGHPWVPASNADVRSPCPALNALANHGYLNRNGKDLTVADLVAATSTVFNIEPTFMKTLADGAIHDLGTPSEGSINGTAPGAVQVLKLDSLNKHDVIEHDASLSRNDIIQGDNHSFQPQLLVQMFNISAGDVLSFGDLARLRNLRDKQSQLAGSPKLSLKNNVLATGESSLLLQLLGTPSSPSAKSLDTLSTYSISKNDLEDFFSKERLPTSLLSTRANGIKITIESTGKLQAGLTALQLADSSKLLGGLPAADPVADLRDGKKGTVAGDIEAAAAMPGSMNPGKAKAKRDLEAVYRDTLESVLRETDLFMKMKSGKMAM